MTLTDFTRLQYIACTLLGYSMAEYHAMAPCDIVDQWDMHLLFQQDAPTTQIDEDGVVF